MRARFDVDDDALSTLHADAFGGERRAVPWAARLERHSVSWVGAFAGDALVGFVHAVWDGGVHAFVLDTAVAPAWQRQGLGTLLVGALVEDCARRGITWMHVDFEPHLTGFYRACGFGGTGAGLLRIGGEPQP